MNEQWCIPPKANAEFVCQMEDVLDVYHSAYNGKRQLQVTRRRTKQDWAKCVKWMVDELYPDAEKNSAGTGQFEYP